MIVLTCKRKNVYAFFSVNNVIQHTRYLEHSQLAVPIHNFELPGQDDDNIALFYAAVQIFWYEFYQMFCWKKPFDI